MIRFTSSRQQWTRRAIAVAVAVLFMPGLQLIARQKRRSHHVRKAAVHRRRWHYRRRYVRVHISPERVRQIQQALVKAGFFHEKPDGIWGSATREAMRQYQKENGFSPTGLPEAKPLMKLGLGPHPLPPGLAPHPPKETETQGGEEVSTNSSSPPAKKDSSSAQ